MENSRPHAGSFWDQILDRGPVCSWIFNPDLRFEQVRGDSARLFRHPAEGLSGRHVSEVLIGESRPSSWRARLARVFQGEALQFRETACGDPAPVFWVALFPLPSPEGIVRYAAGLAHDISAMAATGEAFRWRALHALRARDADQAGLARFLHDEVAQHLTAVGLQLDVLRMDLEATVPGISSRTSAVQERLEILMDRVREFSLRLNPVIVGRVGIHAALDRMAGRLRERCQGTIRLMTDSSIRLPAEVAAAFYTIAEQAAENALCHSGCSCLEILLKSTRNGPTLEVRDNGTGFDTADAAVWRRGLGLLMMEDSASQAGITLSITSDPGMGTTVRAVYPVATREQQDKA
jgi:signal transduction histidine kinase